MARERRIVRQLPVGLWVRHDRYLQARATRERRSEADIVRDALDDMMALYGHLCVLDVDEDECAACGGDRGQV